MGILDDAIREHLELKRQHGAEGEDLERLENEAFGPTARPGDPDFAEPSTETGEQAVAEPPSGEQAADETGEQPVAAETPIAEAPSEELVAEAAEPATEEPASGSAGVFDVDAEFGEEAKEIPADMTPAERARIEHADLDDTADHPGPVQLGPEDEAEPDPGAESAAEPGAAEAPEKDIFADEDFTLEEIDLTIEDEPESGEQEVAKDDDDLLEETPDFLQETEGEDLWFEQGPPRDFDFDDD